MDESYRSESGLYFEIKPVRTIKDMRPGPSLFQRIKERIGFGRRKPTHQQHREFAVNSNSASPENDQRSMSSIYTFTDTDIDGDNSSGNYDEFLESPIYVTVSEQGEWAVYDPLNTTLGGVESFEIHDWEQTEEENATKELKQAFFTTKIMDLIKMKESRTQALIEQLEACRKDILATFTDDDDTGKHKHDEISRIMDKFGLTNFVARDEITRVFMKAASGKIPVRKFHKIDGEQAIRQVSDENVFGFQ